ncbi:MAG: cob(I)yrinic acid a,c-diamide adenosyltransferase [Actinomycetota bacterium]|nr:cob(I)yrinic acid a,c-diamide adenosyltransferase [Actinomycetota bacterium]
MVKIYTRKGDDGTTSLWYGGRVPKHDARTDAYGSIDEANSQLGVARALCGADSENRDNLASDILQLQQELFVCGAELATAPESSERLEDGISRVTEGMVDALEVDIDRYMRQVDLPPQFVIPGGTQLSAALDVARAMLRRGERRVVALRDGEGLGSEVVLAYLNRASDLLFAMARFADERNPQLFEGRRKGSEDA